MADVDLICLAISYKYGGRCVAGLRTDGGGWVRPVTAAPHGAFGEQDLAQIAGFGPRVLDVIRVGLKTPKPLASQPENWLIDGQRWRLIERPAGPAAAAVLERALCRGPALLGSTGGRIADASFRRAPAAESLALVEPAEILWRRTFDENTMRLKDRAAFDLAGVAYELPLTDPVYLERMKPLREGEHESTELGIPPRARVLLTISLSEPYQGQCYKLAAAVVVLPPL